MTLVQTVIQDSREMANKTQNGAGFSTEDISYTLTGVDRQAVHANLGGTSNDDTLLPLGLDSHRYRCCGNGVVAPVAEWIGRRIVEVDRRWREEDK